MRLVRLAMCVAAFAVVGKIAFSEDIDVQSLQAKLAAQEARLNDLQAKMNSGAYAAGGEVEGLLSANKNAVVTIGGTLNTRYFYRNGKSSGGDATILNPREIAPGQEAVIWYDSRLTAAGDAYSWIDGGIATAGTVAAQQAIPNRDYDLAAAVPAAAGAPFGPVVSSGFGSVVGALRTPGIAGWYINDSNNYADGVNAWRLHQLNGTGKRKVSQGNLTIADAKLTVHIDVNEYFDAFLKIDLQSSTDGSGSDNAEQYWVRWKNVCNSGFGLKVGRDVLTFGEGGYGVLASYAAGNGDGLGAANWGFGYDELANPLHNNWDEGRYVQVTPYWESKDGKFSAELSLYQSYAEYARNGGFYDDGNTRKSRNLGWGSASLRLRARPIEGLLLSASVANFHDKAELSDRYSGAGYAGKSSKNNTFVDFAFNYRPCFFNRMMVWGQWVHGWNVDNVDDLDSDAINLGVAFDLNEAWTIFVQGDYMKSKGYGTAFNTVATLPGTNYLNASNTVLGYGSGYDKATAWAAYAGVQYKLPYGVMLEAGWKYEEIKWKKNVLNQAANVNVKDAKLKGHTVYAHLGFDF